MECIINNTSFLHPRRGIDSNNRVDVLGVGLNNLQNIGVSPSLIEDFKGIDITDDLYIDSIEYEEFNHNIFFNAYALIKSKSNVDLYDLFQEFNQEKVMLIYGENVKPYLERRPEELAKVKKVYPVAFETEPDHYIVHHNFYYDMLHITKKDIYYTLTLCTPGRSEPKIVELIGLVFGGYQISGTSIEEVLDKFYNGMITK